MKNQNIHGIDIEYKRSYCRDWDNVPSADYSDKIEKSGYIFIKKFEALAPTLTQDQKQDIITAARQDTRKTWLRNGSWVEDYFCGPLYGHRGLQPLLKKHGLK